MPVRIPKSLKQKRNELTGQRQKFVKAVQEIDREIRKLDYAIKLIAPDWQPPAVHRAYRPRKFKKGAITKACLDTIVHLKGQFETKELAEHAAKICNAKFESRAAEESFLAAVGGAVRRLAKIGALEECGQIKRTRAILWRTRLDSRGWLGPLKTAA